MAPIFEHRRRRLDPTWIGNRVHPEELARRTAEADKILQETRAIKASSHRDHARLDVMLKALARLDQAFKKSLKDNHYSEGLEAAFRGEERTQ